jgi:hypothetical protein
MRHGEDEPAAGCEMCPGEAQCARHLPAGDIAEQKHRHDPVERRTRQVVDLGRVADRKAEGAPRSRRDRGPRPGDHPCRDVDAMHRGRSGFGDETSDIALAAAEVEDMRLPQIAEFLEARRPGGEIRQ